jgi:hypothetical protein
VNHPHFPTSAIFLTLNLSPRYLQIIYVSDNFCDCGFKQRCSVADMNEAAAEGPAEESDARDPRGGAGREQADGQVRAPNSSEVLQIDASQRTILSMFPC